MMTWDGSSVTFVSVYTNCAQEKDQCLLQFLIHGQFGEVMVKTALLSLT